MLTFGSNLSLMAMFSCLHIYTHNLAEMLVDIKIYISALCNPINYPAKSCSDKICSGNQQCLKHVTLLHLAKQRECSQIVWNELFYNFPNLVTSRWVEHHSTILSQHSYWLHCRGRMKS